MKQIITVLLCVFAFSVFADKTDDTLAAAAKLRAERKSEEAVKLLEDALPEVPDARLRAYLNYLAKPYWIAPDKGEEYLRKATLAPCDNPTERARTYSQLGYFLGQQKKYEEADKMLKLGLQETAAHPAVVMEIYYELSRLAKAQGNNAEALQYAQSALKAGKRIGYKVDLSWLEKEISQLEAEAKTQPAEANK